MEPKNINREYKKKLKDHARTNVETNLYLIYDEITEKQGPVFEGANHQHAIRSARPILMKEPTDYKLMHVGYRMIEGGIQAIIPTEIPFLPDEKNEKNIGQNTQEAG